MFKSEEIMLGTTNSTYNVVAVFATARIGVRQIAEGFRVRVEVCDGLALNLPGWKTPGGGQSRYSTVTTTEAEKTDAVLEACSALVSAEVATPEETLEWDNEGDDESEVGGEEMEESDAPEVTAHFVFNISPLDVETKMYFAVDIAKTFMLAQDSEGADSETVADFAADVVQNLLNRLA